MALSNCQECGNEVSTFAASCPRCGAPVAAQGAGTPLSTIQLTSKRLKVHMIVSALAFWIGLIWYVIPVVQGRDPDPSRNPVAVILLVIGIAWYIITKLRIWWHHK